MDLGFDFVWQGYQIHPSPRPDLEHWVPCWPDLDCRTPHGLDPDATVAVEGMSVTR